jgi:hypothetical protein
LLPALVFVSLVILRRWGGSDGEIFALASRQRRSGILIVSGSVGGGTAWAAGMISALASMWGSSSLSDFPDSLGTGATAIWLWFGAAWTNEPAGGVATLIAIEATEVTRHRRAIHIVLVILDPKARSRGSIPRLPHRETRRELIFETEFGRLDGCWVCIWNVREAGFHVGWG